MSVPPTSEQPASAASGNLDRELVEIARGVAEEAGALVERLRRDGVRIADTKSSGTDIVTVADRASEELIRARVMAARPDDGFLGEEGDDLAGTSGVRWIVDPIDGTVNYAHGLPNYAVSVAAEVNGEVRVGVVRAPAADVEYVAVRGGGATCNSAPIAVAAPVEWSRAVVGTGFSYRAEVRQHQAEALTRLLPAVADIRRLGSCALDLCEVAAGHLDGYVEDDIGGRWDFAAGALIAEEAGARVEVFTGLAGRYLVVAAPARSYPGFRQLVGECGYLPPST